MSIDIWNWKETTKKVGDVLMAFDWKQFADIAKVLAPIVVTIVNPALAPLGSAIGHAIGEAESIPDASGPDKLQHVQSIVTDTATAMNNASVESGGKEIVNTADLNAASKESIEAVVAVTNLLNKQPVANDSGTKSF